MTINDIVANNLNRLRTELNLSLGQLAERSGVSKMMLSQLEKGDGNPTINTLWKIANGLETDYSQLITSPSNTVQIVRQGDIPLQKDDNDMFLSRCYFPATSSRRFDIFTVELLPKGEHYSAAHSPRTQEYVLIQQGTMELIVGTDYYMLKAGDSICFDCTQVHNFRNATDEPIIFTDIVYYQ